MRGAMLRVKHSNAVCPSLARAMAEDFDTIQTGE